MTDNEIIKALECCISTEKGSCKKLKCPMINECRTDIKSVEKYALNLINRQKAEIERLKKDRDGWRDTAYHEASNAENLSNKIIIEFAERLKGYASFNEEWGEAAVCCCEIDNLVKEMVGDE